MVGLQVLPVSIQSQITGKFVAEIIDARLTVHVELAVARSSNSDTAILIDGIGQSILAELKRLNSEYANYVPVDVQLHLVRLYGFGNEEYFKVVVKHKYVKL